MQKHFVYILLLFLLACTHSPLLKEEKSASSQRQVPAQKDLTDYLSWLKKQGALFPSSVEKKIIISYVQFLDGHKPKEADRMIQTLILATQKNGDRLSDDWLSLFEGNFQLIHKTQSLGTISVKYFEPFIKSGDPKSVELFLVYSATVKVGEAESESLSQYAQWLQEHHAAQLSLARKKYSTFFSRFPPIAI